MVPRVTGLTKVYCKCLFLPSTVDDEWCVSKGGVCELPGSRPVNRYHCETSGHSTQHSHCHAGRGKDKHHHLHSHFPGQEHQKWLWVSEQRQVPLSTDNRIKVQQLWPSQLVFSFSVIMFCLATVRLTCKLFAMSDVLSTVINTIH